VKADVFSHPDWLEPTAALGREDAIARAAQRTGVALDAMRRLVHAVPPSLTVFPETVDLLYRLKRQGYPLYCLSNMHFASIEYLEQMHDFWDVFDGRVISCRLQLCKPESAIYEHLLQTYGLAAKETLFIDDVQKNLDAAASRHQDLRFENAAHAASCGARGD
jgi:putative hydrolase of the HAD superfamily